MSVHVRYTLNHTDGCADDISIFMDVLTACPYEYTVMITTLFDSENFIATWGSSPDTSAVVYPSVKINITGDYSGVEYYWGRAYNTTRMEIPEHKVTIDWKVIYGGDGSDAIPGGQHSGSQTITVPALPAYNPNTAPTITPSSSSLGNIYSVPSLSYTIKDVNNDNTKKYVEDLWVPLHKFFTEKLIEIW